jgi:hypothetical protein
VRSRTFNVTVGCGASTVNSAAPGSVQGLILSVCDFDETRAVLTAPHAALSEL